MKKTSTRSVETPEWRRQLPVRLKEGALIAMGALCLYLIMALLTYERTDPGLFRSGRVDQVQNAAGRAGAWFADLLFGGVGYFAICFPCCWRSSAGACSSCAMHPGM